MNKKKHNNIKNEMQNMGTTHNSDSKRGVQVLRSDDYSPSTKKIAKIQNTNNNGITMKEQKLYAELWHKIDWKGAIEEVNQLQKSIALSTIEKEWRKIYKLQRTLIMSFAGRALAVRRVVRNSGGKTAGIDGIILNQPYEYYKAIDKLKLIVEKPREYVAKPVKRVYIPKPGKKEMRGLGIPTIQDRMVQAIYHLAVDPAVEVQSDLNSFGFRKERSTHDAISYFRNYMDKHYAARWVLEADISKCFDKISHDYLMKHTPICDKHMLKEWLKCGFMTDGIKMMTEEGSPQGGIISPLLCNVALNGLEQTIKEHPMIKKIKQSGIKIIRYADDITITGTNEEILKTCKKIVEAFLLERGLTLNVNKTKIIKIEDGIDLLGFNIRRQKWNYRWNAESKQKDVLIIKPNSKSIQNIKNKIGEIIKKHKKLKDVILELNPILRGWTEYMRISPHSRKAFFTIDHHVWLMLRSKYVRSRQGRRNVSENFAKISRGKGRWGTKNGILIFNLARAGTTRVKLKKLDKNPYILSHQEYFQKFKEKRLLTKLKEKLYKKYKHKCTICGETLHNSEIIEIHHIKPRKEGGSNKINNLIPLHRICHKKVTHEVID